jgi:hypothetical protein
MRNKGGKQNIGDDNMSKSESKEVRTSAITLNIRPVSNSKDMRRKMTGILDVVLSNGG